MKVEILVCLHVVYYCRHIYGFSSKCSSPSATFLRSPSKDFTQMCKTIMDTTPTASNPHKISTLVISESIRNPHTNCTAKPNDWIIFMFAWLILLASSSSPKKPCRMAGGCDSNTASPMANSAEPPNTYTQVIFAML